MSDSVRLTHYASCSGCAAKQPPGFLLPLLESLPVMCDPAVLVGSSTLDDAAVIRISDETAIVLTADFFPPIVDDPFDYGEIAAANSLSDVYAMGGRPFASLALVCFPGEELPRKVLQDILTGASRKAAEAGAPVLGGHTIRSAEPVFGLSVAGLVHPGRILRNSGAVPGDALVLTKPIGTSMVATAAKHDKDSLGAIGESVAMMKRLNRDASAALAGIGAHAVTDVTGFGLLGHLRSLAYASGVSAEVDPERVPLISAALDYARAGLVAGGTRSNRAFLEDWVQYGEGVPDELRLLLCDAQTSGGLLSAVDPDSLPSLIAGLEASEGCRPAVIGRILEGEPGRIHVRSR
ncbi:MAG: selenide, water dikinase SelD [Candidatus Fermentibacter sp.]|nr:selenide, water dikinase SelD [Candidatus Fermentibacter sp.]